MAEIQTVREFVASVVSALHNLEVRYSEPRVTPLPYFETMAIFDQVLAAHDAEVAANAVEDAATEANLAWVAYRPDGWGSNDSDNEALSAFLWALKWLRARAAELTRDTPSR